jgi:hypothetical protein
MEIAYETRKVANYLTNDWLRCSRPIEINHSKNKISQEEIKAAMIEASARLDYLLRIHKPHSRFVSLPEEYIFDFAFKLAIVNNMKWKPTKRDWESMKKFTSKRIYIHKIISSEVPPEQWMIALMWWGGSRWDVSTIFDGEKLIKLESSRR